ncbi:pentapeptide repeat-containing protein [Streptomyces sp. NPDC005969]|uniref:pentapeptide repeat-containing protein n=1 Tax=Streptomyces sp. NPDC005969 TaxID=3156722 RepID=UPI0033FAF899
MFIGLPWLIWRGPYLLDGRYINIDELSKGTGSATLVTGLRTAIVAAVAACGAGIALIFTARTYRLTRRGQVTERFTKALERLGADDDKIYVRIGGILALEQIVQDAPEQATHAAHVLGHFVRHRAPAAQLAKSKAKLRFESMWKLKDNPSDKPAADVQSALTALTRKESRTYVDRDETLRLAGLTLTGAELVGADLTDAVLHGSNLQGANLEHAVLHHADLRGANLRGANLRSTNLRGANLRDADLAGADLDGADLSGADLQSAKFEFASLADAEFHGANVRNADFRSEEHWGRGVTLEQIIMTRMHKDASLPGPVRDALQRLEFPITTAAAD